MRTISLGKLGCISPLLLPSALALNAFRSSHVAEFPVMPNNLTLMTPQDTSSVLERQIFDFGAPFSTPLSGLRRLGEETVVGVGCAAELELFVMVGDVAYQLRKAAITRDVAIRTRTAVREEAVARGDGQTCINDPQTTVASSASPTATPIQAATSTRQETSTPAPAPESTTRVVGTQTSVIVHTQQSSADFPLPSRTSTRPGALPTGTQSLTTSTQTTQAGGSGVAIAQSQSTTSVGAIVGGTVAGVVAIAVILMFLIIWRRKQTSKGTGSEKPAGNLEGAPPYNNAYSPEAVPPTPGTVDPFLTPMVQPTNMGVSYFSSAVDRPASGTSSTPQYTGLPEPQHGDDMGVAIGTSAMPVPRHDTHHPHPLPMSITPLREPVTDSGPTGVWPGFNSRPTSRQTITSGGGNIPYQTPSGWSNHETTNSNLPYLNAPNDSNAYDFAPPRAPSTVYQPSSEGGDHNGYDFPPPGSPPPESLYSRAFTGNLSGLPSGAAPPVTNFATREQ